MSGKVVLIGIDGATFRIIRPLVEQGRMPHTRRLMEHGVQGVLKSTIPPVSPVAWTSLMTGANPGRHRIFDFAGKLPGSYEFRAYTAADRRARPFWMHASEAGKRVLVIGVTMTYPPDPVNGYMISGLGTPPGLPLEKFVHPPEFAGIVRSVGDYRTVPKGDQRRLFKSDGEKDRFLEGVAGQIENRTALFTTMWARERFDFSMLFFLDTDGVSHYFWTHMAAGRDGHRGGRYADAIFRVYEQVDAAIGKIVATIGGEADVMLASDHGFGPLRRVVFMNNFLAAKGYLAFRPSGLLSRLKGRGRPAREIDWTRTRAYFSGTVGNIFVNRRGRYPGGIVSDEEYRPLCEELRAVLAALCDPATGEPAVEAVYWQGELYGGEVPEAPDIVMTFRSGYSVVGDEIRLQGVRDAGEVIADANNWSGTHEPDGILVAHGAAFKKGAHIEGASLVDIAPTVLHRLGVPVPQDIDGRVLEPLFEEQYLREHPPRYVAGGPQPQGGAPMAAAESQVLLDLLRNLGYIE